MRKTKSTEGNWRSHGRTEARSSAKSAGAVDSRATAEEEGLSHPLEAQLGGDVSQGAFQRHAALLGDGRLSHPMYAGQRAMIAQHLQHAYGNRYVQGLVGHISRKKPKQPNVQRWSQRVWGRG